jgi:hypothetical protein
MSKNPSSLCQREELICGFSAIVKSALQVPAIRFSKGRDIVGSGLPLSRQSRRGFGFHWTAGQEPSSLQADRSETVIGVE